MSLARSPWLAAFQMAFLDPKKGRLLVFRDPAPRQGLQGGMP